MEKYKILVDGLRNGDAQLCAKLTSELLDDGETRERIVSNGIHPAMDMMNSKCTSEQFNLLELMLTGRAVLSVIKTIYPDDYSQMATRETVVVAALEGDIHDLGKGIVKMALSSKGFKIIDCGKDASLESVIETAISQNAAAVCISGLISGVIPQVAQLKSRLTKEGGRDIFVLAGGAALSQCSKEELNVDFVGRSAFDALNFLEDRFGGV